MKGYPRIIGCVLMGAGLLLAPPTGIDRARAQAQVDTLAQAEGRQQTLRQLRERIEERYRVLPVQDGIVLIPQVDRPEVQSIELSNGDIAVDGVAVTGAELRRAAGEDADEILRLSYLDATARQVLFGIGEPPVAVPDTAAADTVAEGPGAVRAPGEPRRPDIRAESQGDRVRMGGNITVQADEHIDGDVVAVGGSVRILGSVDGDVSAIGGTVRLGPDAVVDGDVTVVGGRIHREPGAVVRGSIEETSWRVPDIRIAPGVHMGSPLEGLGSFVGTVVWIVFLGLLTALAYLVARRPVERMEYRVGTSPWKAAAVGLAAQILFIPVLVLTIVILAISIVGIPLLFAIPFAIVALGLGVLVGFTAVAMRLGREAESRFGWAHASSFISIMVGVGLIMAVSFFGAAIGIAGGPLEFFGTMLTVFGFVIQYVAWTIGLGVLLLTRFGTRYNWAEEGTPAPPPSGAGTPAPPPTGVAPAPTGETPPPAGEEPGAEEELEEDPGSEA